MRTKLFRQYFAVHVKKKSLFTLLFLLFILQPTIVKVTAYSDYGRQLVRVADGEVEIVPGVFVLVDLLAQLMPEVLRLQRQPPLQVGDRLRLLLHLGGQFPHLVEQLLALR